MKRGRQQEEKEEKQEKEDQEGHKAGNSRVGKETRGGNAPDAEVPRVKVKLVAELMTIL